jgi:hypothetical protein
MRAYGIEDLVPEGRCDWAGHDWHPAGGGMLICGTCEAMRDADEPVISTIEQAQALALKEDER